ncbi:DHS-like NAD/FAD-binding domain-containing protein [Scleroderma citrinum]
MTIFLPLDGAHPPPSTPPFLLHTDNTLVHLRNVVDTILKAKRLVVVCGAGISVQAGIPDFRSPSGLFQTLKRDNPKEALTSGRDLFDASVFNSEHTTSLFCQMIAQLSELSQAASPTPFHQVLRSLDQRGGLLRVYTQNIDAIEFKSGLSFGVPEFEDKRYKPRSRAKTSPAATPADPLVSASTSPPTPQQLPSSQPSSRHPSPAVEVPRCIPLHGTLQTLHCQTCTHTFPLEDYIESLTSGTPPYCPECTQMEETRQLIGKRARGVGKLRPSVVLYNEMHKDGEDVGEVVRRDLVGGSKGKGRSGADILLVVGTSLRVPGTKRIVREFSKAVRSRTTGGTSTSMDADTPAPIPSPRWPPRSKEGSQPMRSIYLNLDFPVPTREWEGVFDAWVQGDAQSFAQMLMDEITKKALAKEAAVERKRKREEGSNEADTSGPECPPAKKQRTPRRPSSTPMRAPASAPAPGRHSSKKPRNGSLSVPRRPHDDRASAKSRTPVVIQKSVSSGLTIRIPSLQQLQEKGRPPSKEKKRNIPITHRRRASLKRHTTPHALDDMIHVRHLVGTVSTKRIRKLAEK